LQAFIDFSGCFALTCENPNCNAGFCAFCLADCGSDAHPHVRECSLNPKKGEYFHNVAVFHNTHKERNRAKISEYIGQLNDHMRKKVLAAVAKDLADVGIIL